MPGPPALYVGTLLLGLAEHWLMPVRPFPAPPAQILGGLLVVASGAKWAPLDSPLTFLTVQLLLPIVIWRLAGVKSLRVNLTTTQPGRALFGEILAKRGNKVLSSVSELG